MYPVLAKACMKRLKIILQSKQCIWLLLIITVLIILLKIPTQLYYTTEDNNIIGIVKKIAIQKEKVTLEVDAKEKIIGTYYFTNQERKKIKSLQIGDKIKLYGKITTPSKPTTKNMFDYSFYLKKKKIYHQITISKLTIVKKNKNRFYNIKNSISKKLTHPYMQAFLLGNDEEIAEEVTTSYQENGISHLLAISGMQFYLIANIILKLLQKTPLSQKTSYLMTFIIVFLYFILLDRNVSILRGVLFFFLFSINRVWHLELSKKRLILFTILITIMINPYFVTEVAFWYSYVISIGLLYFQEKNYNYWKSLWYSSLLSFLLSIPISLYFFYQINLLSVIYNMFYIPYVNMIIFPLTIITACFSAVEPLYQVMINILESTSLFLSKIEIGKLIFPKVSIWIYIIEFFIIILYIQKKRKKYFLLVLIIFTGHYASFYIQKDFIKIIDVGQGDSALIFSKGKTALIDTGGKRQSNQELSSTITKYTTIPLLKSLGVKKLNFIFLTHGDTDHIAEVFYLINHFKVEKIYINLGSLSSLEEKLRKEFPITKSKQGMMIEVGNFTLCQLNKAWSEENTSSSVYYLDHPQLTALFMGDATKETENYLLENYDLKTDILKVGHHGSKTSTGKSFLTAISPRLALISVGENNSFNHPNQEVLDNLEENKIPVLMTKDSGTITIFPNTEGIMEDKKER